MAIILKTCFHDPPIGKYEKTKGRNDTRICPFKRSSPFPPPFPLVNHRDVSIARSRRKGGQRGGGRPISPEEDSIAFAFPCPLDKTRARIVFCFLFFFFSFSFSAFFLLFFFSSTMTRPCREAIIFPRPLQQRRDRVR